MFQMGMGQARGTGGRQWLLAAAGLIAAVALLAAPGVGDGAATPAVRPTPPGPPAPAGAERFIIDPATSTVAYRVGETALTQNRFRVAAGVTSAIQGEIVVDPAHPTAAQIGTVTVDISQFRSDSARRDNAIRTRWLESEKYPAATFTATAIDGLPGAYEDGRVVPVRIAGLLTMRTVAQPVTFTGTVTVEGSVLTSMLHTTIRMTDFGFEPPSLLGIFRVDDDVLVELRVTARRAA